MYKRRPALYSSSGRKLAVCSTEKISIVLYRYRKSYWRIAQCTEASSVLYKGANNVLFSVRPAVRCTEKD